MKKLLFIIALAGCHNADPAKARQEAEEYASHVENSSGVECNDTDSDGDGYISCTVFRKGEDPLAISCGAENWCAFNCASGCKLTPARVNTQKSN